MSSELLSIAAIIALSLTSLLLLVSSDWRFSILLLALQYVGMFLLIVNHWPIQMAVVKLISGWMAGAVLGIAIINSTNVRTRLDKSKIMEPTTQQDSRLIAFFYYGRPFHLITAGLVAISVFYLAPQFEKWIPEIDPFSALGGLLLIGMGLLKLGFSDQPFMVILGLLTMLSGFEIIYANLETSALVAGLLAIITLGLALTGAYLLAVPDMEKIN